jgi:hypothetical protein
VLLRHIGATEATIPIHSSKGILKAAALPDAVLQRREAFTRVDYATGANPLGQSRGCWIGTEAPVVLELVDVVVRERPSKYDPLVDTYKKSLALL